MAGTNEHWGFICPGCQRLLPLSADESRPLVPGPVALGCDTCGEIRIFPPDLLTQGECVAPDVNDHFDSR